MVRSLGSDDTEPADDESTDDPAFDALLKRAAAPDETVSDDVLPLRDGDVVDDRYRIERPLAKGGMGVVFQALDLRLDHRVAIKLLLPRAASDPKVRKRFDLEARLAVQIRSEHSLRVLNVGTLSHGAQYLVMELLEGQDLAAVMEQRGPLPVEEVVDFVLQACEAISEAHALGIVHRDLKPANIFLTTRADGSPCVKVIDFGLAKTTAFGQGGPANSMSLTQGALLGTPRNMAPEQIRLARDAGPRADIWAIGTILYELLTGRAPFAAPSIHELFAQILHQEPPPLTSPALTWRHLPDGLERVIRRCLEKDPAARYEDIATLVVDLAPFAPESARTPVERARRLAKGGARVSLLHDDAERRSGGHPRRAASAAGMALVANVLGMLPIAGPLNIQFGLTALPILLVGFTIGPVWGMVCGLVGGISQAKAYGHWAYVIYTAILGGVAGFLSRRVHAMKRIAVPAGFLAGFMVTFWLDLFRASPFAFSDLSTSFADAPRVFGPSVFIGRPAISLVCGISFAVIAATLSQSVGRARDTRHLFLAGCAGAVAYVPYDALVLYGLQGYPWLPTWVVLAKDLVQDFLAAFLCAVVAQDVRVRRALSGTSLVRPDSG